ncbi:MAG TPA: hypothetical protein VIM70_06105 [Clostridium sp.]|uniref:hypothetical protein n=1 Tax=Clostridium sp. TaxID=1506 RepID=UPI002F935EA1
MEQFKLDKHWDDFKLGKLVINCKTEQLVDEFAKYCYDKGMKWGSGASLIELTYWTEFGSELCYSYHNGMSNCQLDYYKEEGYKIVEFNGFNTKLKRNSQKITTKEIIEVIYHGKETIVLLKSGGKHYKGVVKLHYNDTYNKEQGFVLAYNIAREKQERGVY